MIENKLWVNVNYYLYLGKFNSIDFFGFSGKWRGNSRM